MKGPVAWPHPLARQSDYLLRLQDHLLGNPYFNPICPPSPNAVIRNRLPTAAAMKVAHATTMVLAPTCLIFNRSVPRPIAATALRIDQLVTWLIKPDMFCLLYTSPRP